MAFCPRHDAGQRLKWFHASFLGLVALLGASAGFRLTPDTEIYASGTVFPYQIPWPSVVGLVGLAGGYVAVVAGSVIGSALCGWLIQSWWFTLPASYFFLFPGADSLGVAALLVCTAHPRFLREIITALIHPPAALVGCPGLWKRGGLVLSWVVAVVLIVSFSVAGLVTGENVNFLSHLAFATRYVLPALALTAIAHRSQVQLCIREKGGDGRPTTARNGGTDDTR